MVKGALSQDAKGHGNHEYTFSSHCPPEAKLFPLLSHNGAISLSRDKWWILFQCLLSLRLKEKVFLHSGQWNLLPRLFS